MHQPGPSAQRSLCTGTSVNAAAPIDIRLHAPTPDTVIVRVGAGALRGAAVGVLAARADQQLYRASHVIVDLGGAGRVDAALWAVLAGLRARAERCGTRLHLAGIAPGELPPRTLLPVLTTAAARGRPGEPVADLPAAPHRAPGPCTGDGPTATTPTSHSRTPAPGRRC